MTGKIDTVFNSAPGFLRGDENSEEVILASRIRLARNLADLPFPAASNWQERRTALDRISRAAEQLSCFAGEAGMVFHPDELPPTAIGVLRGRRLLPETELEHPGESILFHSPAKYCQLLVNHEDHIRLQIMAPGGTLNELWKLLSDIDDELSEFLEYAFSPGTGYLTARPENAGTGLRASLLCHLPALTITGRIKGTIKGLAALKYDVSGYLEETGFSGDLYVISNQSTLGESEPELLAGLLRTVNGIAAAEKLARRELLTEECARVLNQASNCLALISSSYYLEQEELLDLLSGLRFGTGLKLFRHVTPPILDQLFWRLSAAELQFAGNGISPEEENIRRAGFCRNLFRQIREKRTGN